MKKVWIPVAVAVAAVIIGCGTKQGDDTTPEPAYPTVAESVTTPTTAPETEPSAAPSVVPKKAKPVSAEQANATRSAESYLSSQSFSRKGLIDQLKFEGYGTKAATAAVDSLRVDWNAQAVLTAKSYLENQAFSRKGLTEQLEYEGFTRAQAAHGVSKSGL